MFMPARKLTRDERGMSLVFVGLGLMGFVAATMLAIDVGMLMTARTQAQNSADAGAHAGAVALAFVDYSDRSTTGPAVTSAVNEAVRNQVMAGDVKLDPSTDVVFLNDPAGEPNRVRVTVYRDAAHGNAMGTFIAKLFGTDTMDISAVATAEASPADIPDRCLPFTIPDRWDERTNPPFNPDTSYFELYAGRNGNNPGTPLANPDVYVPLRQGQTGYTGYTPSRDKGTQIKLKTDPGTTVSPSVYNPIVVPGTGTGAENYYNGIVTGACPQLGWGAMLTLEPGNMVGPTEQGIEDLVAKDPDAQWDDGCNCVVGSRYNPVTDSPRVAAIPLYDPYYYETHQQTGRNVAFKVANYLGVFVEDMRGGEVYARIIPTTGHRSGDTNIPGGMFLKTVRIVQ
jgi:hypothetical protein